MRRIRQALTWVGRGFYLFLGVPMVALGLTGFVLVGHDGLEAHLHGVRGVATVTNCAYHARRWECTGTFVSADSSVRIDKVDVLGGGRQVGDQVTVTINGRRGANAWPTDDRFWWRIPILILLFCGGVGAACILYHRSLRRERIERKAMLVATEQLQTRHNRSRRHKTRQN